MATARTLPMEQEVEQMAATQNTPQPSITVQPYRRALNPVLVVILVGMIVFPFLARFLPGPVIQHLEAIFH